MICLLMRIYLDMICVKRRNQKCMFLFLFSSIDKCCCVLFLNVLIFFLCRPEAMGVVTGCIFLIALFLFIPIPFIFKQQSTKDFPHDQVCCVVTWSLMIIADKTKKNLISAFRVFCYFLLNDGIFNSNYERNE